MFDELVLNRAQNSSYALLHLQRNKIRLDDFQGHSDLFNTCAVGFASCHIEQIYIASSGGRIILTEII